MLAHCLGYMGLMFLIFDNDVVYLPAAIVVQNTKYPKENNPDTKDLEIKKLCSAVVDAGYVQPGEEKIARKHNYV